MTSSPSMRSGVAPRETVPNAIEPSQSGTCALTSGSTSRLSVVSMKVLMKGHSCATIWFIHSADSIASSWPASTRAAASISDVVAVSVAAMVPAVAGGRPGGGEGGRWRRRSRRWEGGPGQRREAGAEKGMGSQTGAEKGMGSQRRRLDRWWWWWQRRTQAVPDTSGRSTRSAPGARCRRTQGRRCGHANTPPTTL